MVRQDSVDLNLSRVIFDATQPVGVALIARAAGRAALAAMSIIPAAARARHRGEMCSATPGRVTRSRRKSDDARSHRTKHTRRAVCMKNAASASSASSLDTTVKFRQATRRWNLKWWTFARWLLPSRHMDRLTSPGRFPERLWRNQDRPQSGIAWAKHTLRSSTPPPTR